MAWFQWTTDLVQRIIDQYESGVAVRRLASQCYQIAINSCGNSGQLSIITGMGIETFEDAAQTALEDEDATGALVFGASHPEAVEVILDRIGNYMNSVLHGKLEGLYDLLDVVEALSNVGDEGHGWW